MSKSSGHHLNAHAFRRHLYTALLIRSLTYATEVGINGPGPCTSRVKGQLPQESPLEALGCQFLGDELPKTDVKCFSRAQNDKTLLRSRTFLVLESWCQLCSDPAVTRTSSKVGESSSKTSHACPNQGDRSPFLQNLVLHKSRIACIARGIISLPIYIVRKLNRSSVDTTVLIPLNHSLPASLRQTLSPYDWQCLAKILTLSTNPLIRSSYWLACPFIKSWPCLRTSSEETSISSSCSFSVFDVAYYHFVSA